MIPVSKSTLDEISLSKITLSILTTIFPVLIPNWTWVFKLSVVTKLLPLICLSFFVCKYVKWSAFSQLCSLIFYIYILKGVISEALNIVEFHFNNYKLACKWKVIGVYLLVKPHWCVWFNHHGYYALSHVYQLVWKWLLNSKQLHNSSPLTIWENHLP